MRKHKKGALEDMNVEELSTSEETIAVLPANMFDSLEFASLNELTNAPIISGGGGAVLTSHMGRDTPFPCFKKGRWQQEGVIEIIQKI